jgi:alanine-synthesizing transaminase
MLAAVFARRAGWDLTPNAFSACVAARRAAGLPLLDLADSNPTRCGIAAPGAALREVLAGLAGDAAALRYAPDPRGDPAARAAVAACHARGAWAPSAEHVLLTAGTSEGYAHLYRLLADPGDRVHLPTPGYPLFAQLAELEGLEVAHYPLRAPASAAGAPVEGTWRIDLDALAADLSPRSRAIVVIDPHNPTGSFVHADDRAGLAALAAERHLALISDEVFADYALGQGAPPVPPAAAPLRFTLSGASKLLGLPQLKLAWIVVAGAPALRDEALARLDFVADAFLSVSPLVARVLPALLAARGPIQAEIRARVAANLERLDAAASASGGFELLRPQAGWSAILRLREPARADPADEEALALALLDAHGVLVQPGYLFDLEPRDARGLPCAHLVVSLLPEPRRFERGIDALRSLGGSASR